MVMGPQAYCSHKGLPVDTCCVVEDISQQDLCGDRMYLCISIAKPRRIMHHRFCKELLPVVTFRETSDERLDGQFFRIRAINLRQFELLGPSDTRTGTFSCLHFEGFYAHGTVLGTPLHRDRGTDTRWNHWVHNVGDGWWFLHC